MQSVGLLAASPWLGLGGCNSDDLADPGADSGTAGGQGSTGSSTDCCSGQTQSTSSDSTTGTPDVTSGSSSTTDADGSTGMHASTGADATTAAGSTGEVACEPSPSDIEGPFYRPGIPVGGDLDVHGDSGVPLLLQGAVFDTACQPIAGAVVEIWHATPVTPGGGPGDINATYDDTPQYRYYGQVATDDAGRYAFTTLRPGWYLNGDAYRPAHIHLKVWVGGVQRLTTQVYFADDPFNGQDPWFNPTMAIDPGDDGEATLDIVL